MDTSSSSPSPGPCTGLAAMFPWFPLLHGGNSTLITMDGSYAFSCQSFSKDCELHEEGREAPVSFTCVCLPHSRVPGT